jgi:hypothetical protein
MAIFFMGSLTNGKGDLVDEWGVGEPILFCDTTLATGYAVCLSQFMDRTFSAPPIDLLE